MIKRLVERFDDIQEVLPYLAARIIADACEGLHAAHTARGPGGERLGIVHRDVSPQNLFLTYDGSMKVVDFGCAKAAERVAHTSTGVMKGKVGYAAPEQLKSDRTVDARADVWALGVCLWETLTLSPLFTQDTAVSTAMSVLQDDIERADDGREWVPKEIADIVDKALQRDKSARYESARDMGRALRHFIANSGYTLESVSSPSGWTSSSRSSTRRASRWRSGSGTWTSRRCRAPRSTRSPPRTWSCSTPRPPRSRPSPTTRTRRWRSAAWSRPRGRSRAPRSATRRRRR